MMSDNTDQVNIFQLLQAQYSYSIISIIRPHYIHLHNIIYVGGEVSTY